jgi:hypothetical protein
MKVKNSWRYQSYGKNKRRAKPETTGITTAAMVNTTSAKAASYPTRSAVPELFTMTSESVAFGFSQEALPCATTDARNFSEHKLGCLKQAQKAVAPPDVCTRSDKTIKRSV